LPDGAAADDVHIARELAAGELSRTMVLLVDAPDGDTATAASRAFEAALRAEPRVGPAIAWLDTGPPAGIEDALYSTYQPRRFSFLADGPEAAAARLEPAAIEAAVADLKRRLQQPLSGMLSRIAPGDPLLILPQMFERIVGNKGEGLRIADGRFLTDDGAAAVLFLTTQASASDSTVQGPLLAGIDAAFAAVDAEFDGALRLSTSGTNRFAVRAEQAIKADIQRVSIGSTVGLCLLFLALFRSLRLFLLVLPVLGAGFLAGTTACLLLFGSVHGLTLAFGAALIGVGVDYAVHFQCHHLLSAPGSSPRQTLRSIWSGLGLGAATTVIGFVALMLSSFPGLRQLAVFAACGITASLFATRVFLPGLAGARATATSAVRRLADLLDRAFAWPGTKTLAWSVIAIALIVAVTGLPALSWNDGIASLQRIDPQLLSEDTAVRERVVRFEQRRLVLAIGDDEEGALQANDAVARVLSAAEQRGELGAFRNLAGLVPSAKAQLAVDAVVRSDRALAQHLDAALTANGFHTAAFAPFREALAAPPLPPLRPGDLEDTPLAALIRPFRVSLGDQVGCLSFLFDIRDEAALRAALATVPGARLIDIEQTLDLAYGAYREGLLELWLLGLLAVLALVAARHRAVRPTLLAYLPAVLAAAATVGALSLFGFEFGMLSLVALLMVVSMGVDYGVFLAESQGDRRELRATRLAVTVAGASTMLGFGLLAGSDQPALFGIGITAGLGVLLCMLLAPAFAIVLPPRSPATSHPGAPVESSPNAEREVVA
ncbi:MAG: MMPL family transporter, partial [Planctomycetes bacterium]|nr:MMPL family transporter [Planctomycetota bacterium]